MKEDFKLGSSTQKAREAYEPLYKAFNQNINVTLGLNTSAVLTSDPKLFLFTLSKYKFAMKMLDGAGAILEVGCMDGAGTILLSRAAIEVTSIDYYKPHIMQANTNIKPLLTNASFIEMDFLDSPYDNEFDGLVCFDVLEHVDPTQSKKFVAKIHESLKERGVCILGMPSLESQVYASLENKKSHINCMTAIAGRVLLEEYFKNIFIFSMNDEVVHTGYLPMAHYHIYLCVK